MIKSYLLIILLTVSHLLFSQELSIINYSTKDGLPSSEVYDILQDKNGYMWFATDAGVAKFNGKTFKVFDASNGLSDNTVFGINEDIYGRIWCRTYSGKIHYIKNDSVYGIAVNNDMIKLVNGSIANTAFLGHGDTLHVSYISESENSRVYFKIPESQNFKQLIAVNTTKNPSCKFIYFGKKKNFVYTTRGKFDGVDISEIIDSNKILKFNFNLKSIWDSGLLGGLFWKFKKNQFLAVLRGDKSVWIDSPNNTYKFLDFKAQIISFCEDNESNIWIGLKQKGVLFFKDGNLNSEPTIFFKNQSITSIEQDFEEGMWFTTVGNGIYYAKNNKVKTLKNIGPTNVQKTNKLYSFRNSLYFLTREKNILSVNNNLSSNKVKKYSFNNSVKKNLTDQYKFYFKGQNYNTYIRLNEKNAEHIVTTYIMYVKVIEGNRNLSKIALANSRYLTILNKGTFDFKQITKTRILSMDFNKEDNLLLGTHFGIKIVKNDSIQDYKLKIPYRINDLEFDDKDNLWIATNENGVYCHAKDSLYNFNVNNGLINNKVNEILILKNQIWVATYGGISKIEKNKRDFLVQNFNTSHGLLSNQTTDICFFDNQILTNSNDGINVFMLHGIHYNSVRPKTVIKSILVNDEELKVNGSLIELDYFKNNLNFEIDVLSYKDPDKNLFKSRLIGYDDEFKKHSNNEINYTNLSPGYYELWVYGINNDGFESLKPNIFKFKIEKPFWLKWWFIVSEVLIVLLIIYLIFRYRIGLVKKEEAEKTAINKKLAEFQLTALRAQMNPHFIFNAISSVQHYVLKNDINQSYDYLAKFSHLIRTVLNNSNQSKIHLDQEIETLRLYISLEKLRFENDFEFFIDIQKDLEDSDITIPSMLIQPFVENSIWHGLMPKRNDCILKLSFSLKNENLLQVIIEDNGIGRVKSKEIKSKTSHKSKGMFLTTERIELLRNNQGENSKVEIVDLYDEQNEAIGTKVILEIQID